MGNRWFKVMIDAPMEGKQIEKVTTAILVNGCSDFMSGYEGVEFRLLASSAAAAEALARSKIQRSGPAAHWLLGCKFTITERKIERSKA